MPWERLKEEFTVLLMFIPRGMSFDEWYEEMDPGILTARSTRDRAAVMNALSYLQGAADALDLTIMEMSDEVDIEALDPRPKKHWRPRRT